MTFGFLEAKILIREASGGGVAWERDGLPSEIVRGVRGRGTSISDVARLETRREEWGLAVFSQTVEYALRAVTFLAASSPQPQTTEEIARATKVPRAYLSKVLQNLVRAKVVTSQRGIKGGIALARAPAELTILEVVNAVEPIRRISTCPLGLTSHGTRLCPLHRRLDTALAMVEDAFRGTTLAEILGDDSAVKPLCESPSGVVPEITAKPPTPPPPGT